MEIVLAVLGGGALVVHIDEEYSALDKTWQEILDALSQGARCVTLFAGDDFAEQGMITAAEINGPPGARRYEVGVIYISEGTIVAEQWIASSAGGYPALVSGE